MLNYVLILVLTNFFKLNCFFKNFSTSSAETSGLKRETKRALDRGCFKIIGKRGEFHTPI
jgi:hypothetical protein